MFKKPNKKRLVIILLIIILCILAPTAIFKLFGLRFNYTPSIPIGIYKITPDTSKIQPGDIVSFCLPNDIAKYAIKQNYITKGTCKNGSEGLIKEVIAIPGNTVIVKNNKIRIYSQGLIEDYQTPSNVKDYKGIAPKHFIKTGKYIAKGYWMYGYGDIKYSFDSRYFGEIPKESITHKLKSLITF